MQSSSNRSSSSDPTTPVTWVWDATHQLYYSPQNGTYAYPDANTGQWHYVAASSLASSSTQQSAHQQTLAVPGGEREDGEIEDDMGWGALMEPEELNRAIKGEGKDKGKTTEMAQSSRIDKHPAYAGSGSRDRSPSPARETPDHLIRLVVLASPSLMESHVAVIDAREGGVQLGRDRCEKGGHPRVRVKEMEVSKNHAVVYWGKGGDEEKEGWWVVDLGSTHGTFVSSPSPQPHSAPAEDDIDGEPLTTDVQDSSPPRRLSEPKTSSLPYPLAHNSVLSLGQTRFEVHIHESWPCETCQLGRGNEIHIDTGEPRDVELHSSTATQANGYAMNSQERRGNRETNRKREMAALKDSLLNRNLGQTVREATYDGQNRYVDRSAIRRQMHPKSPPRHHDSSTVQAAEPGTSKPAGVSAFAQNMMAAQGWAPGSGLGRDSSGRSEAIEVKMRVEKRGLGAQGAEASVEDVNEDWRKRAKNRRFEEMRGR